MECCDVNQVENSTSLMVDETLQSNPRPSKLGMAEGAPLIFISDIESLKKSKTQHSDTLETFTIQEAQNITEAIKKQNKPSTSTENQVKEEVKFFKSVSQCCDEVLNTKEGQENFKHKKDDFKDLILDNDQVIAESLKPMPTTNYYGWGIKIKLENNGKLIVQGANNSLIQTDDEITQIDNKDIQELLTNKGNLSELQYITLLFRTNNHLDLKVKRGDNVLDVKLTQDQKLLFDQSLQNKGSNNELALQSYKPQLAREIREKRDEYTVVSEDKNQIAIRETLTNDLTQELVKINDVTQPGKQSLAVDGSQHFDWYLYNSFPNQNEDRFKKINDSLNKHFTAKEIFNNSSYVEAWGNIIKKYFEQSDEVIAKKYHIRCAKILDSMAMFNEYCEDDGLKVKVRIH